MTGVSLSSSQKRAKIEKGSNYSLDFGQKKKNVSDHSYVLAPFNSTITQSGFDEYMIHDLPILDKNIVKFNDKCREANRQYEFNYNGEVDNGIFISLNSGEKKESRRKKEQEEVLNAKAEKDLSKKQKKDQDSNQPATPVKNSSSENKADTDFTPSTINKLEAPQVSDMSPVSNSIKHQNQQ